MEKGVEAASCALAEDSRAETANDKTRERLSSALRLLMVRKSYSKIDVGSIAAASGLTRKSFYYHFASKDELLDYLVRKDIAACEEAGNGWEVLLSIARCMHGSLMAPQGDPSCSIAAAVFIDRLSQWVAASRPLDPVAFILSYRTDLLKFSGACLGRLQA